MPPPPSWEMSRAEQIPVMLRVTWPQHRPTASPCCWGQPLPALASLLSPRSPLRGTQGLVSLFSPHICAQGSREPCTHLPGSWGCSS